MRFKTEEEFIQTFGPNWKDGKVKHGWVTGMNYFFGKEIEEKHAKLIREQNLSVITVPSGTSYSISQDMVIDDMINHEYQFLTINQAI